MPNETPNQNANTTKPGQPQQPQKRDRERDNAPQKDKALKDDGRCGC